jgi:hypothetical protein
VPARDRARARGRTCPPQVRDVYYTSMLLHLGCTAPAHELTHLFGDDVGSSRGPNAPTTRACADRWRCSRSWAGAPACGARRHLAGCWRRQGGRTRRSCVGVRGRGPGWPSGSTSAPGCRPRCATARSLGRQRRRARPRGDDIALPARFALLATQAVLFDRLGARRRRRGGARPAGHWFDPEVADCSCASARTCCGAPGDADVWDEVLEVEPTPVRASRPRSSTRSRGSSPTWSTSSPRSPSGTPRGRRARGAAPRAARAPDETGHALRRAALLHDLGRVAVSGAVWEQPRR